MTAQDYYWSSNRKITLVKDNTAILVKADEKSDTEQQLAQGTSIKALERINSKSILARLKSSEQSVLDALSAISNNSISSFKSESGDEMIPTGEILFQPKKGVGFDKINKLAGGKLSIVKEKYGCYRVFVDNYRELLNISNKIYESGLVEYSHPNFIMEIVKLQNDPLYPDQYYLNNTGQFGGTSGIDINAPQAWGISTGVHDVRVAVIDDGVENHIDINGRVVQGFTPLNANGFGAPVVGSQHGEACAGIIAATRNNNEGIAGIAPCTDIVPLNIFTGIETTADLEDAIDWAWDEGQADVLSNSWSFTAQNTYHDNIAQAIGRARTQGRGGDGSVVVFASGNFNQDFSGVAFPANVPGVITVGAIDNDGNIWNYSSRGSEMDLVAPSGNVNNTGDVRTTDRPGVNGYTNGNYTNTFGGTSAACPQVSGVAALMLSVNPELTEAQVVSILKNTATNMGPSGFDNTYGYGRVNAQQALQSALPTISGPNSICTSGTMSISVPSGTTVTWSVSPSNSLNFSGGGSSKTFTRNGSFNGSVTITANISGGCGNKNITKSISVGNFLPLDLRLRDPITNNPVYFICRDQPTNVKAAHDYNAVVDDWQWDVSGAYITYDYSSSNHSLVTLRPYSYNVTVKIRAENSCGWSEWADVSPDIIPCGMFFTVYPNPSDSEVFITANTENELSEGETKTQNILEELGPINLELYNFSGKIVRERKFEKGNSELKINVSGLIKGNYFLRIVAKEVDEIHQIVVE
jgi:subtilisin family serine protease